MCAGAFHPSPDIPLRHAGLHATCRQVIHTLSDSSTRVNVSFAHKKVDACMRTGQPAARRPGEPFGHTGSHAKPCEIRRHAAPVSVDTGQANGMHFLRLHLSPSQISAQPGYRTVRSRSAPLKARACIVPSQTPERLRRTGPGYPAAWHRSVRPDRRHYR